MSHTQSAINVMAQMSREYVKRHGVEPLRVTQKQAAAIVVAGIVAVYLVAGVLV